MVLVSLDQSTKLTGWCLWIDGEYSKHGLISHAKEKDSVKRFKDMAVDICSLFNTLRPDEIWIEDTALQSNPKVLKDLCQLQGIIIGYCLANNIPYGIISPNQWRKVLSLPTGRGVKRPELKQNSINYVKQTFGIITSEDECEAITIGKAVIQKKMEEMDMEEV